MIEKLYNCCITRIDPYSIEDDGTINDERYMMSENIMIGCITHLQRKRKTRPIVTGKQIGRAHV